MQPSQAAAPAAPQSTQSSKADAADTMEAATKLLLAKAKELTSMRRKRTKPEDLSTPADIEQFAEIESNNTHKSSKPGILALDIHPSNPNLIVSGGVDSEVVLFDRSSTKKLATLKGHSKKVTAVGFHAGDNGASLWSASADKTVKVWTAESENKFKCATSFQPHKGGVIGAAQHTVSDYILTASHESWAFSNMAAATTVASGEVDGSIHSIALHPDGQLFATGTEDVVRIWDLTSQQNVVSCSGHEGKVSNVAFSENGYYMVSIAEDSTARVWDLRKPKCVKVLEFDESEGKPSSLCIDHSGDYFAVGLQKSVQVYAMKKYRHLASLQGHSAPVMAMKFGASAKFLATASMDRSMKVYANNGPTAME